MKQNPSSNSTFVRLMAIFLAALMLLGAVVLILQLLPAKALSPDADTYDAYRVRVGFDYGADGVVESFTLYSENGFILGHTGADGRSFTPVYSLNAKTVSATIDQNLGISGNEYAAGISPTIIGGYHLELSCAYSDAEQVQQAVASVTDSLRSAGLYSNLLYPFVAYYDDAYHIRIGDLGTYESASEKLSKVQSATGYTVGIVEPDPSSVTYIDRDAKRVLFEFQSHSGIYSALCDAAGGSMQRTSGRRYAGTIEFARSYGCLRVVNLVPIETYVEGVLPYEVSNTWPAEALKAFAVCVRSYLFASGKHKGYGIDICNDTCCQAYRGSGSVNGAVVDAVAKTKGIVMTYGDTICSAMYSAVTGGCTVDAYDLYFLSDPGYLKAVQTPWERYWEHKEGLWANAVSARELSEYLRAKGYTGFNAPIAEITINRLANNSTYVNSVTVTDANGNSKTVEASYRVYAMFAKYTNCANFSLYHNGTLQGGAFSEAGIGVVSASGRTVISPDTEVLSVRTADGVLDVPRGSLRAATANGVIEVQDSENNLPQIGIDAINNASADDFVFIGKGWGHGCGLSQQGALNYAQSGADYETILHGYFTGIRLESYADYCTRTGG